MTGATVNALRRACQVFAVVAILVYPCRDVFGWGHEGHTVVALIAEHDIPLAESKIDMARDCPNGQCVVAQTEHFLAVLKDPSADKAAKAEALKFVVHFVGDLHQPLHDEDNGDKGGNARHVTFDGKQDNLHWVWDTGLLEHINRDPQALAADLERNTTPQEKAEWEKGSLEDWVLEGHKLAVSVEMQTTSWGRECNLLMSLLERCGR